MKDQIQFETNGLTVLAVPVEQTGNHSHYDSHGFYIDCNNLLFKIGGSRHYYSRTLPKGKWKLHAVTTEVTEEQAEVLVATKRFKGDKTIYFKSYDNILGSFSIATMSLCSLLRSHGIDPAEKCVLLVCE